LAHDLEAKSMPLQLPKLPMVVQPQARAVEVAQLLALKIGDKMLRPIINAGSTFRREH
jgi:hypothetical protein